MKDLEISKELLSEVLKKEIREFVIEKNELRYILKDDINNIPELYFINIYELSHKCKEWAYKQCYEIISYAEGCKIYQTQIGEIIKEFYADSEQHAIIKACEWILKEQNNDTK